MGSASAQDWSWGAEDKNAEEVKPQETVPLISEEIRRNPKLTEVSAADFKEPLPLEPHSSVAETAVIGDESVPRSASPETEKDRQARFLGLSDTLCDWGIGTRVRNF